jgi:hypothetical protein
MFSSLLMLSPAAAIACFVGAAARRPLRAPLIALGILLLAPMAFVIVVFIALANGTSHWG